MTPLPSEYGPLVTELHRRSAKDRRPVSGTFELTARCNLRCRMCYVRQPAASTQARTQELSAAHWLDLARAAVDHGTLFLLLTGGEVFLRPDFFEIYTPLTEMGLMLTLFTNGTLITGAVADRLAEAPPSRTEITLYGATQETYEAVTGAPGSYARCLSGIDALADRGVPLSLKTTLTRQNVGELEAMRDLAHARGLPFSAAWLLTQRRDGEASEVGACRLSPEACVTLEAADRASANELSELALRDTGDRVPYIGDEANFYCQAGKAAFTVSPHGEMNACLDLTQPAARPLVVGFSAAWEAVQHWVDSAPPMSPVCQSCDVRGFCPRCPAWSLLETSTMTEPVPYLCDIARARADLYNRRG